MPDAGGLGICSNIFLLAATVAEMRGDNILTADMLRAAHRELVNSRAFAELERHLVTGNHPPLGRRLAG